MWWLKDVPLLCIIFLVRINVKYTDTCSSYGTFERVYVCRCIKKMRTIIVIIVFKQQQNTYTNNVRQGKIKNKMFKKWESFRTRCRLKNVASTYCFVVKL